MKHFQRERFYTSAPHLEIESSNQGRLQSREGIIWVRLELQCGFLYKWDLRSSPVEYARRAVSKPRTGLAGAAPLNRRLR